MSAIEVIPRRGLPRSPLRYPGGKASLAGFFNAMIARRGLNTYVEPYAGGAGAAIELLLSDSVGRIIINDLDPAIFAFWKSVRERTDEFLKLLAEAPLTLPEWRKQQVAYRHGNLDDYLSLGFATFYLNRTNRSGVMNAGVIGGQAQDGKYKIGARFDRDILARRIQAIADKAGRITVTNFDGVKCIRQALRLKSALIYVDPPYYEKGSYLYLNSFDDAQHSRLAELLNKNNDGSWILTYDDHDRVRQLYRERKSFDYKLHYSAHRTGSHAELMIVSDRLASSVSSPSESQLPLFANP